MDEHEAVIRASAMAVTAAEAELATLRAVRNKAMKQARDAGLTYRAIAEAAGMTQLGARKIIEQHPG